MRALAPARNTATSSKVCTAKTVTKARRAMTGGATIASTAA
jgi:hypothetical protein